MMTITTMPIQVTCQRKTSSHAPVYATALVLSREAIHPSPCRAILTNYHQLSSFMAPVQYCETRACSHPVDRIEFFFIFIRLFVKLPSVRILGNNFIYDQQAVKRYRVEYL
jgi:hypothetical protein